MVTQARFELATPSFGGWCSIQAELLGHPEIEAPGHAAGLTAARLDAMQGDSTPLDTAGGAYWTRTSDLRGVNTAL